PSGRYEGRTRVGRRLDGRCSVGALRGRPEQYSPVFFFQAEDGIRDWSVTGVQTCALPIFCGAAARTRRPAPGSGAGAGRARPAEIGRASCRERVEMSGGAGSLKKKNGRQPVRVAWTWTGAPPGPPCEGLVTPAHRCARRAS